MFGTNVDYQVHRSCQKLFFWSPDETLENLEYPLKKQNNAHQTLDFDFQKPLFHPVWNLLALNDPTNNTLVFMGPSSDGECWVEKGCLPLPGRVKFYDFSSDGRSLEVTFIDSDDHVVLSIWDIVATEPNTGSKRRRYDLRPRLVK